MYPIRGPWFTARLGAMPVTDLANDNSSLGRRPEGPVVGAGVEPAYGRVRASSLSTWLPNIGPGIPPGPGVTPVVVSCAS
jgi:hypothetical protein